MNINADQLVGHLAGCARAGAAQPGGEDEPTVFLTTESFLLKATAELEIDGRVFGAVRPLRASLSHLFRLVLVCSQTRFPPSHRRQTRVKRTTARLRYDRYDDLGPSHDRQIAVLNERNSVFFGQSHYLLVVRVSSTKMLYRRATYINRRRAQKRKLLWCRGASRIYI